MSTYFSSRRITAVAVGGLLAAMTWSGGARAVTDTIFKYKTPKTGWFSIGPTTLIPLDHFAAASYTSNAQGLKSSTGSTCFTTGVNLPQGATMTVVTVWWSSGTGGNPTAELLRIDGPTGAIDTTGLITLIDDSGARITSNIPLTAAQTTVNNNIYNYAFGYCSGGVNDVFYAARVTYTYTNAGD